MKTSKSKRAPSQKRLAVANRYSNRLKYLEKKGYDTSDIKDILKAMPGIAISDSGRIRINNEMYSTERGKQDILKALETWVPTSTKWKGSEPEQKSTRKAKSKALEVELTSRADEVSAKFGFSKEEFLRRAEDVEGIMYDEESKSIKVDPDSYNSDLEKSALNTVYSAEQLMEDARNELIEEEGLSEGDVENLSNERIIQRAKGIYMFKDERSVFKKYYDYFDRDTHIAKSNSAYKKNKISYDKAQKAMSDLGRLLAKGGFKSSNYQEKRIEVDNLINELAVATKKK